MGLQEGFDDEIARLAIGLRVGWCEQILCDHFRTPNSYPELGAYAPVGILHLRYVEDS